MLFVLVTVVLALGPRPQASGQYDCPWTNNIANIKSLILSSCPSDAQTLNNEKYIKINGKYWSSYVQWINLLLLTL